MDTVIMIDAPLWLRLAIYLWLIGKASAFIVSHQRSIGFKYKQ